jgi:hypothetical protein
MFQQIIQSGGVNFGQGDFIATSGDRAVAIGCDVTGSTIVAEDQQEVDTGGSDFVGRDQIISGDRVGGDKVEGDEIEVGDINIIMGSESIKKKQDPLIREEIPLDVATPKSTIVDEYFKIAVAVKQISSPTLSISDLDEVIPRKEKSFANTAIKSSNIKFLLLHLTSTLNVTFMCSAY